MKKLTKKQKRNLVKEMKLFLKCYFYTLCAGAIVFKAADIYAYRDNIYYHSELKLSDEELKELEEEVSTALGQPVKEKDNAIIIGAAIENDNLTETEKETIYQFTDLLNDNPYLDKTNAYNNFEKLDIIYDSEADYGKDVMGVYINYDNEITIIKESDDKGTILHELVHCTYSNNNFHKLPRFLNEGMTELLTNEYFMENPFIEETSYPFEITMVKILCEIVGPDKVLETYSTGDIKILEEALAEKTGLAEPHELIENMESVLNSYEEDKKVDKEKLNDINSFLDKYYSEVDKSSMDYELYIYYKHIINYLGTDSPELGYIYDLMLDGYYVKPYFSSKLKEKYKDVFKAEYYQDISSKNDDKKLIKYNKITEKKYS